MTLEEIGLRPSMGLGAGGLLIGMLCAASCDDTANAVVDQTKEAATQVAEAVDDAERQARRETAETKTRVQEAVTTAEIKAKQAAEDLEKDVDKLDKAVADEIRED
jgi:hypothetical protein